MDPLDECLERRITLWLEEWAIPFEQSEAITYISKMAFAFRVPEATVARHFYALHPQQSTCYCRTCVD